MLKHALATSARVTARLALAAVAAPTALMLAPTPASAATITVNSTADSSGSQCTLRAAIAAANADHDAGGCSASGAYGTDMIKITATGQIKLQSALDSITTNMAIVGPGEKRLDVHRSSGGAYRIFTVTGSPTVSISDLMVSGGSGEIGAGISNAGTLTLRRVRVSGNAAAASDNGTYGIVFAGAGGIANSGSMTVLDSTITGNTATATETGGSDSSASADGGGIVNFAGPTLTIRRSTISGNTASATDSSNSPSPFAAASGGGAYMAAGRSGDTAVTLQASTVSGNLATASVTAGTNSSDGGGVFSEPSSATKLAGDTIASNGAIYGANYFGSSDDSVSGTIIADPKAGSNCVYPGTSTGFNLEGPNPSPDPPSGTCGFNQTTDHADLDPRLGPLADNGGPTETRALMPNSPALDRIPARDPACTATDQRGIKRPKGPACDIGAFERAVPFATTGRARAIRATTARLSGSVNPQQRLTSYRFEYGKTRRYGLRSRSQTAGAGTSSVAAKAKIRHLAANTTYHYRLVATNGDGTTRGRDRTFKTARQCVVPKLVGMKLGKAKKALRRAHCRLGKVKRKKSSKRAKRVLSQSRRPGAHIRRGSKVSLVVSKH